VGFINIAVKSPDLPPEETTGCADQHSFGAGESKRSCGVFTWECGRSPCPNFEDRTVPKFKEGTTFEGSGFEGANYKRPGREGPNFKRFEGPGVEGTNFEGSDLEDKGRNSKG
jgi:hypothetical protein